MLEANWGMKKVYSSKIPSSYYSSTKAAADLLVISANRTFGLPYLITRTCNNYGENQHHEKFIPKIIQSIKNNVEVPVYGDGKQVRDWLYVQDKNPEAKKHYIQAWDVMALQRAKQAGLKEVDPMMKDLERRNPAENQRLLKAKIDSLGGFE